MNIFFYGCGGFFSECYSYLIDYNKHSNKKVKPCAIFDDYKSGYDKLSKLKILKFSKIAPSSENYLIISVGDMNVRKKIIKKCKDWNFFNLIHPSSYISSLASFGKGCVIAPNSSMLGNARSGDFLLLNVGSNIFHDCQIGNNNNLCPSTNILGGVKVGSNNFFGSNCQVLPKLSIGNNNIFGASSTVTKNVSSNKQFLGTPAKIYTN